MALETTSLALVEEWKRKCCEFSTQSKDLLVPLIAKVFDTLAMVLKNFDHSRVLLALKCLESKHTICLAGENNKDLSIRTLIYGVIQSVHRILLNMIESIESDSAEAKSVLLIVEEWKRKCCEFSTQSDDILIPVIVEVLDAIALILMGSDISRIHPALKSLESERSICLAAESNDDLSIRTLMYGLIQCIHGTLLHLTTLKESIRLHDETHNNQTANMDLRNQLIPIKKEEMIEDDRRRDMDLQTENGFSTVPDFTVFPTEPKKEPIDVSQVIPDDNHMHDGFDPIMDEGNIEIASNIDEANDIIAEADELTDMDTNQTEKEEETEENADKLKDSSENIEVKQLRKSTRKDVKRNSHGDAGPSMKKSRSDSKKKNKLVKKSNKVESKSKSQNYRIVHRNYIELECPECEFRTASVMGWETHLKFHSTTPSKAGLILRCECGNESFSATHSRICKISKIKVVRMGDGTTKEPPVSRINHKELECPECEYRTMSVVAWTQHLNRLHDTTLTQAGLILRCECGNESLTFFHSRICKISKITVVRKEDGTTKKSQAS